MLAILKNEVVTDLSKKTALLRQKELNWFCSNYWIFATQATLIGGFSFRQLCIAAHHGCENVSGVIVILHIMFTSVSFIASLYVLVHASFSSMFAPGLALRGPNGFASIHRSIWHLRQSQDRIMAIFLLALTSFVFSAFLGFRTGLNSKTAVKFRILMLFTVIVMIYFAWRITVKFYHSRTINSGLRNIERIVQSLGDLNTQ